MPLQRFPPDEFLNENEVPIVESAVFLELQIYVVHLQVLVKLAVKLGRTCRRVRRFLQASDLQLLRCQNLYVCTGKASKLSTYVVYLQQVVEHFDALVLVAPLLHNFSLLQHFGAL